MDRVKRIWYLSPMRAAKVQAILRIRAVSPELSLLAHTSSESRGTFRQKARSLAPLSGWACAVKIYHDGMLEDTNSLDGAHVISVGYMQGKLNDILCSDMIAKSTVPEIIIRPVTSVTVSFQIQTEYIYLALVFSVTVDIQVFFLLISQSVNVYSLYSNRIGLSTKELVSTSKYMYLVPQSN